MGENQVIFDAVQIDLIGYGVKINQPLKSPVFLPYPPVLLSIEEGNLTGWLNSSNTRDQAGCVAPREVLHQGITNSPYKGKVKLDRMALTMLLIRVVPKTNQ